MNELLPFSNMRKNSEYLHSEGTTLMVREKYTKDSLIPILRRPVTCGEQKHTVVVLLVVTGRSLQHLAFNLSEHNTDKMKRWLNPKLYN